MTQGNRSADGELPILIVGAGPVGLSLALGLAHAGVHCEVFEALPELSHEARASTFHPRTLEILAGWGVADVLLQRGHRVHRLQYWERGSRQLVAEFNYAAIAADTAFPFRLQCPQSVLTRVLRPMVEASPFGRVHMHHRYLRSIDLGDHVEAEFETTHGHRTVRGRFLCAADGSRSAVRQHLNIPFEGKTYEDRFLLVACTLDVQNLFPGAGPVCYFFDPVEWVIVLQLPDVTRIVFRLREDEDEAASQDSAAVAERIGAFVGRAVQPIVKGTSVYKVHQRVAETFHKGNAVLLGDAAHINNPMGGMGMNSGIHDAHALVPHLCALVQGGGAADFCGWAGARRAFALNDVRSATDKNYVDMSASDTGYRATRNADFRAIANDPVRAREFLLRAAMLEERLQNA